MRAFPRTALVSVIAAAAIAVAPLPASATSEWDLDYFAPSGGGVSIFGVGFVATIGQTFVVPTGPATLDTFSLRLSTSSGLAFRAVLQAWDPATQHATGAPLYMSDPMSTGGTSSEVVTASPAVAIPPGTYVAYFTVSYDWESQPANGGWFATTSPYADGTAVAILNGTDESQLARDPWLVLPSDLAFSVAFSGPAAPPVDPPVDPPVTPPADPPATPPAAAPAGAPAGAPTTPAATPVILPPAYTG